MKMIQCAVVKWGRPPPGDWSVLIWFHPGDFSVGTPSIWDGSTLAIKQKVIVVTASYRLNIFGFMAAIDKETPGNLGLLDQIAILDWVQEHIKYFNGSKYDVTLWGHSAGAVSISLHLLTELSSGKFHKAILMSGNFLSSKPIKNPLTIADIADQVNCGKDSIKITLEECLQNVDTDDLLKIAEGYSWGPVLPDQNKNLMPTYLTQNPETLLLERESVVNSVPLMMGYTDIEDVPIIDIKSDMEFQDIIKGMIEDHEMIENLNTNADNETCNDDLLTESVLFFYTPSQILEDKKMYYNKYSKLVIEKKYGSATFQLGKYTSKKNATYVYRFDYRLKTVGLGETKEYPGVPQQHELPFFWGMPYWATLSPQVTWNSQDKRTSDIVMGFLGNFTKYSRPVESKRNMQWDALDMSSPSIFIIDKIPNMSDSEAFDYKSLSFWNDYYPKLKNQIKHCCSLINTASGFSPIKALLIIIYIFYI
ncbi:acetylcholinesterase isoform X2 [Halyomorpha halys]|uniref:acetylcholinesterase isoform X2 n=1 Tax=Halyomorpha halys TaxID=286706 RepID=UPI0006D5255F|nr:carboxylesterase 5A isoform X2 [Halyomorpha halys]